MRSKLFIYVYTIMSPCDSYYSERVSETTLG